MITLKNLSKKNIFIFALISLAAFVSSAALFTAQAYHQCASIRSLVSASIDGKRVTFQNYSSSCVHIGVAVYRVLPQTSSAPTFYYSDEAALRGSSYYTFSVALPSCSAYVIDVIVGEPLKTVQSSSDYGGRLLFESTGSNFNSSCEYSYNAPLSGDAKGPYATNPPLPSPKSPLPSQHPPAPTPEPEVLGAHTGPTSTNPLTTETGSDGVALILFFGTGLLSGIGWYLLRRRPDIVMQLR